MKLAHQPPEQRLGVAFARTLFIIVVLTLLGWVFSKPEGGGSCSGAPQPHGESRH